MEEILAQIVEKISSYNIVNNLYPGILFVYVLKLCLEQIYYRIIGLRI